VYEIARLAVRLPIGLSAYMPSLWSKFFPSFLWDWNKTSHM